MTIRFVTDENFKGAITRGLIRQKPSLDIVRVQDVGLRQASDPVILEWAAQENRILLSHDVSTIPQCISNRLAAGLPVAGVFLVIYSCPVGRAIDDILLLAEFEEECWGQTHYIPL